MTRVKWKGPYIETKLSVNLKKGKIRVISRNSEIIPKFIGKVFHIYNGKTYLKLTVNEKMIGHKFGEFAPTRKKFLFKKKKKI